MIIMTEPFARSQVDIVIEDPQFHHYLENTFLAIFAAAVFILPPKMEATGV